MANASKLENPREAATKLSSQLSTPILRIYILLCITAFQPQPPNISYSLLCAVYTLHLFVFDRHQNPLPSEPRSTTQNVLFDIAHTFD